MLDEAEHPFEPVTVTEYVVVDVTVTAIEEVVAEFDHKYVYPFP